MADFRKASVAKVENLPTTDKVGVVRTVRAENVDYEVVSAGPPLYRRWQSRAPEVSTTPVNNINITVPGGGPSSVNLFGDVFRL